jgi:hypothetical protein
MLQAAVDAAALFERLGVRYVLSGGVATIVYGEPRSTLDVDFAVHMDAEQARRLLALAGDDFLVSPDSAAEAARSSSMFTMVHTASFVKIDVHVVPRSGIYKEEIERGRWQRLGPDHPDDIRIVTPEDLVLQKLRWYLEAGGVSEKQWRDVLGILKARGHSLDFEYVRKWAPVLGISGVLDRAVVAAGISDL